MSPLMAERTYKSRELQPRKHCILASEFSAGLGWFCTAFPHISRTPESKIIARAPTHWRFRDSLAVDCGKKVSLQGKCQRKHTVDKLNPRASVTPPFNQQTLTRLVFVPSSRMITAGLSFLG